MISKLDTPRTHEHGCYNLIIVDESGSMQSIYREALGGINETIASIKTQAEKNPELKQFISLATFDSNHFKIHLHNEPASKARFLTEKDYRPCACTPLFDAIGRSVTFLECEVNDDDAVLVTIVTDGYENASVDFTAKEIRRLIDRLTEKGWIFTYIGANQDVMYEAERMGIKFSMAFESDSEGTREMWEKEKLARENYYGRVSSSVREGKSMLEIKQEEAKSKLNFFKR